MKTAVVTLHFGEPADPTPEAVVPFLERVFLANASLEEHESEAAMRRRSRELAERRAPGLLEEYREIGGSPLGEQAAAHAARVEAELRGRGHDARAFVGMQFTEPSIRDAVDTAREAGADRVVGLPAYPLCGQSTTVAALAQLAAAIEDAGWDVPLFEISGWHRHPGYLGLRIDAVSAVVEQAGIDLDDPRDVLVFSAHGTPIRYLEEGSRYTRYVREYCEAVADALDVDVYALGYQNHANRDIPWTQPDIDALIEAIEAKRIVVDPVSFMHEQSETLAELDIDLREEAEALGMEFHRVPVPHDDERFPGVLADLVESVLAEDVPADDGNRGGQGRPDRGGGAGLRLHPCRCRATPRTRCLNGGRADDAG